MLALASPEDTSQVQDYRQILDLPGFMLVPGMQTWKLLKL